MTDTANDPYLGRVLGGKYRLEQRLGIGAVGTVYRAMHQQLGRTVAVKVLRASMAKDPDVVARFTREARLASRVEHPNVVRVWDCDSEPDGLTYLAMELLEGRELAEIIAREPHLASERIVELLTQVLAALGAAHRLGIVHRDLKPENIIVLPSVADDGRAIEVVKVADFGIARVYGESASPTEQITRWGVVSGTPEYMSPEQALADELDGRSDLYACGVILYEMLAGRQPFTGDSPLSILEDHIRTEVPPPSRWRSVDTRLEAVAMRALAKARDDRYADAPAMRTALVDALALPLTMSPPPAAPTRAAPIDDAPSVLIEQGPSVIVSAVESAPSVLIESGPSVLLSTDNEASVIVSTGASESVLLPSPNAAAEPSVLLESGPSVVVDTKRVAAQPVAAQPAASTRSNAGIVFLVIVLLAGGAGAAWWWLKRQDVAPEATPEATPAPVDASAPVVPASARVPSRPLRRPLPRGPRVTPSAR
jgi:serine/threonine-protein kinase